MQFFELFSLPQRFTLDRKALDAQYRALQVRWHPDQFAAASDAERRLAEQQSARINDGYKTLIDPVLRAAYLIEQTTGTHPLDARERTLPVDFLTEQMERIEALDDARTRADEAALEALAAEVAQRVNVLESQLTAQLDQQHNFTEAATTVRKLRFQTKLAADIDDALAARID